MEYGDRWPKRRAPYVDEGKIRFAWVALLILALPALVALVSYAVATDFCETFAIATLVAGATFALGPLLGFLFGIPQYVARQDVVEPGQSRYEPNTNLTQVSDWLTKIIIGFGLVQFTELADTLGEIGDELAPSSRPT